MSSGRKRSSFQTVESMWWLWISRVLRGHAGVALAARARVSGLVSSSVVIAASVFLLVPQRAAARRGCRETTAVFRACVEAAGDVSPKRHRSAERLCLYGRPRSSGRLADSTRPLLPRLRRVIGASVRDSSAGTDEDVGRPVGVARDKVAGIGAESDESPTVRDRAPVARAVSLNTARRDAHPLRRAQVAVADEDVDSPVGIRLDEVGGVRLENDEAPVRRKRRVVAQVVALYALRADADPLGRPLQAIADEDVVLAVGVA